MAAHGSIVGDTTAPYSASITVSAGSAVLYIWGDWNGTDFAGRVQVPPGAVELDYYRDPPQETVGVAVVNNLGAGTLDVGVTNVAGGKVSLYALEILSASTALVPNGDFEAGTSDWTDTGPSYGGVAATLAASTTIKHGGTQALQVTYANSPNHAPLPGKWIHGLGEGKHYTLTGWVRVPSGSPAVKMDGLFLVGAQSAFSTTNDTWERLSVSFVYSTPPGAPAQGDLWVGANPAPLSGNGSSVAGQGFYLDDVTLSVAQTVTIGQAVETDTAPPVYFRPTAKQAIEIDEAFSILPLGTHTGVLSEPFELDQAFPVGHYRRVRLLEAMSPETARPVLPATSTGFLSSQILWGEYGPGDAGEWTPFANREASIGRHFDIYHKFASFDTDFAGHTEWLDAARAGRRIAITWEPRTVAGLNWTTIRDGGTDSYISNQINYLTANYPATTEIIIRFGHEMNANWYPWNPGYTGGTVRCASTQIYKDTWAHVRELVRGINPNIKFWWCPNVKDAGRAQVNILTATCSGVAGGYTITIPSDPGITIGDCVFEVSSTGTGLPETSSRVGTDTRVLEINGLTLTVSIPNKSNFTNARLGFAHNRYPMEDFYPGDTYVDYVGYDAYNALDGSAWYSALEIAEGHTDTTHPMQPNAYDRVTVLHPSAPVWIGETGCADYDPTNSIYPHSASVTTNPCPSPTAKADWYTTLFALDKELNSIPRLGAICFFDRPKDPPYSYIDTGSLYWAHDSTLDSWNAFVAGMLSGAPTVTTIQIGLAEDTSEAQRVTGYTRGQTVLAISPAEELDLALNFTIWRALPPEVRYRLVRTNAVDDHPRPQSGLWRRVRFPGTLPMLLLSRSGTVRELLSEGTQYDMVEVDYVIQGAWSGTDQEWQTQVLRDAGYTLEPEA